MMYVGHFSFDGIRPDEPETPVHGSFTCIVEARSISAALAKYRKLLMTAKRRWDGFGSVNRIYLDDCVEIKRLPAVGALGRFEEHLGEPSSSISTALPGVSDECCVAYGWDGEEDGDEPKPVEPFLAF